MLLVCKIVFISFLSPFSTAVYGKNFIPVNSHALGQNNMNVGEKIFICYLNLGRPTICGKSGFPQFSEEFPEKLSVQHHLRAFQWLLFE